MRPESEIKAMILKIENLEVYYKQVCALNGISFGVEAGQIVSLIGANGAGKSSTLMSICGMAPVRNGTILFKGEDITDLKPHLIPKKGICHIPEGRLVFPKLTVKENLIVGTVADPSITKIQKDERLKEMYSLFPILEKRRSQLAGTLSGGEQQMLAIARGLMSNPELVMMDEPSLGLAPIIVEEIFKLIVKIRNKGKTVLLIEQNASSALVISDYAYVLELGNIVLEGTGKELLSNSEVKKAYLGI